MDHDTKNTTKTVWWNTLHINACICLDFGWRLRTLNNLCCVRFSLFPFFFHLSEETENTGTYTLIHSNTQEPNLVRTLVLSVCVKKNIKIGNIRNERNRDHLCGVTEWEYNRIATLDLLRSFVNSSQISFTYKLNKDYDFNLLYWWMHYQILCYTCCYIWFPVCIHYLSSMRWLLFNEVILKINTRGFWLELSIV